MSAGMVLSPPRGVTLDEGARPYRLKYGDKLLIHVQRLPKGEWDLPFHFTIRTKSGDSWADNPTPVRNLKIIADATGEPGLRDCELDMAADSGSGAYESKLSVVLQWRASGDSREQEIDIKHDAGDRVFFSVDVPRLKDGVVELKRSAAVEYLCRRQPLKDKFQDFLDWQYAGYYVPPVGTYKDGEYRSSTIWDRFHEQKALIRVSTTGDRHDKGSVCSTLAGQFLGYWLNYHEKFKFGYGASMIKLLEGYGAFVTTKAKTASASESGELFHGWNTATEQEIAELTTERKAARAARNQALKAGNTTLAVEKETEISELTEQIKEKKGEIKERKKPWKWNSKKLFKALSKDDLAPGDMLVCSNGGHVWLFVKFGPGFTFPKKYIFGNGRDVDTSNGSGSAPPWYGQDCDSDGWYLVHASGPSGLKLVYYDWELPKLEKELAFWKANANLKNSAGLSALNRDIETFNNDAAKLNAARKSNKAARKNSQLKTILRNWNRDVKQMNNKGPIALDLKKFEALLAALVREVDQVLADSGDLTNTKDLNNVLSSILKARKSAGKPPADGIPSKILKSLKLVSIDGPLAAPAPYKASDFHSGSLYSDTETWQQLATAVENQVEARKNLLNSMNESVEETNQHIAELNASLGAITRPTVRLKATVGFLKRTVKNLNKITKEDSLEDIQNKISELAQEIESMISDPEAGAVTIYSEQGGTHVNPDRKLPRPVGGIPNLVRLPDIKIAKLFRDSPLPWMNGHVKINGGKVEIARTMVRESGAWKEYFEPYIKSGFQVVELKHDVLNSDGWVTDAGSPTFNYDCRPFS